MAKPILVANWKNYPGSLAEAKALLQGLGKKKFLYKKTNLFVAPPLPYFEAVSGRLKGFGQLASQDFFPERGTYTGAVTAEILKSFGTRLAIIGHSERRALGESSVQVSLKAKAALRAGITPLICFGEKVRDAEGEHFEFLREELKNLLQGFSKKDLGNIILAYEPVWAIGVQSKGAIDPVDLTQTIVFIKKVLSDLFGRAVAEKISILYGASVDAANAGLLIRNSGAAGLLVGRASLNAQNFAGIALSLTEK